MENMYLKLPTIEDKEKWIDFIKEYREDNPIARPLGYSLDMDYESWLKKIIDNHNEINLHDSRIGTSSYFVMVDDKIVGDVTIRHNIDNYYLSLYGGHIGYATRPSERNKGYGTKMLELALEKCLELGIDNVMVTCREDNIASAKVIENNHGVLSEIVEVPAEKSKFKKYWINVKELYNNKEHIK